MLSIGRPRVVVAAATPVKTALGPSPDANNSREPRASNWMPGHSRHAFVAFAYDLWHALSTIFPPWLWRTHPGNSFPRPKPPGLRSRCFGNGWAGGGDSF
ncbi:hypothetical protein QLX08_009754 [Tetragonisca angustula]|uniref:Secreted protein n=1 Tax=Tetragonisca angustula TaxID=166442 RepID=A0AAW0ZF13_9HYME